MAGQRLLILPVRFLAASDSLGWNEQAEAPAVLRMLEEEIARELTARGLGSNWVLPEQIIRMARSNRASMPDPTLLPAERLRSGRLVPETMVAEPLGSQLRSLTALGGERLALLPVELRFENAPGGARPVLRVVLVDTRQSMVRWSGEVAADAAPAWTPALLVGVAQRFADLFAAP